MSENPITWWAVTIDSRDPPRLAAFWSQLLSSPVIEPGADRPGWRRLQPLAPHGPLINFQPVAEPKAGKAHLHMDVLVGDIDSAVERVLSLGGTDTDAREDLPRGRIAIMRDPDDNEFCLLAAPAS